MSFQDLKVKYGLENQDFFRNLQDRFLKEVSTDPNMDMNGLIKIIADANHHQGRPVVISAFHQAEEAQRSTVH